MLPTKFQFILPSDFRGEDLNVIFYQNKSNLYNQYKSVERKNSQKKTEYMSWNDHWMAHFQMYV
jgi:hypothetical protein